MGLAALGGLIYIQDGVSSILEFDPVSDTVLRVLDIAALNPGVVNVLAERRDNDSVASLAKLVGHKNWKIARDAMAGIANGIINLVNAVQWDAPSKYADSNKSRGSDPRKFRIK